MSNQLQITGGGKVRNLEGVITGTSGVLSSVPLGAANGVATLDSGGKVPVSQLPSSVVTYLGTWNAATNTPTLVNGTGDAGDMYICNVAGTVNFGAGPVVFVVGDWVLYGSGTWQKSSGQNGTVTSVGLSTNAGAITIGNSPISTSGTITANFNGTNLQYVNGAGNLTTFPTLMTSVGLTMPSAFTVTNSPLTGAGGTLAVTGAGYASQYIRGDGTLADFPSSGGGGSSVSYYLNGGTSQGTIGGVTYYEMSKTADTGTGVDFTKSGDGFIVAFLTDANDPALLNIPAGNWNYEIYASMSANGGTPQMYAELYKYDGTTFTLISTSTNEILYDGTNLNLYTFGMTVPATTLALTDRLAIKLYATNSGGKTTTVHTQDSHLCQVITTFSTGITALNGLTAQVQYFQVGTSGTDFNISSTTATHTFNIPDASASARGLITTGTQTIAGIKTFSSGINVDYIGVTGDIGMDGSFSLKQVAYGTLQSGYTNLSGQTNGLRVGLFGGYNALLNFSTSGSYTYTFPAATGTIALTSNLSSYVPTSRTLTINGTGYDLSADRSWTINSMVYPSAGIALSTGTSWGTSITDNSANWNTAYTNRITSATAPLSIISNVIAMSEASGSVDGYLSRFDWTTFNNKQDALTNPVTGTGTTNYLPKFTGASTIGDSAITDVSGIIKIGTTASTTYGTLTIVQQSVAAPSFVRGIQLVHPNGTGVTGGYLGISVSGQKQGQIQVGDDSNVGDLIINPAGGNLGLGVTPSAWNSAFTAFDFSATASLAGSAGGSNLFNNAYFDGTSYIYKTSNYATRYLQGVGLHAWYTAPSGTAGAAITFTQAMTLFANGNLAVGTTTDSGYKLDVNGTFRAVGNSFLATSSGDVGIGTVSPNLTAANRKVLDINGTSTSLLVFSSGGVYKSYIFNDGTNMIFEGATLKFSTSFTDRLTIASTGAASFSSSVQADGSGNGFLINQNGGAAGLATYSANTDRAQIAFKYAQNYPASNNYTRVLDIVSTGDGTGGGVIRFLTTVANSVPATSMLIATSGNVLIGTTTDTGYMLRVTGYVHVGGNIVVVGDAIAAGFYESSDSRLKTLIQDNYQTKGIASITPKLYTKNGKVELGYYAQDFVGILDSAVSKGSDDMLSLSYREVLVAKVYALEQEIKELKAKLN